jgi:AraC family transcriptional regulator, regulatory protein of adaptative response / methylated-DNA-[protein]-cysteine methyltransferase
MAQPLERVAGAVGAASEEWRWQAVSGRRTAADGLFVYAVVTTGIYCRPTCASKLPRRENVRFFETPHLAEVAGFRACKRCQPCAPNQPDERAVLVTEVCRLIESASRPPKLAEIAAAVGLSPYHVQRVFRAATGITPREYAVATRAERLRSELKGETKVVTAMIAAGYHSSGRLYGESNARLGMTPSEHRAGGLRRRIAFGTALCDLGSVLVGVTDVGICCVLLGDDEAGLIADLTQRFPAAQIEAGGEALAQRLTQVVALIEEPTSGDGLPLDIRGTIFQERVWQALREIPAGEVTTYAGLAQRLGMPRGARAVARACATNAHAVLIPCHRVVRNDGALSGYRWGVARKRRLIEREQEFARRRRNGVE